MDYDLSPEQEAFRKVVRDFAEGEVAPHAEAWDREHHLGRLSGQGMGGHSR